MCKISLEQSFPIFYPLLYTMSYEISDPVQSQTYIYLHYQYRKVESSNTSCLEARPGFFRLPLKGIFDPYELCPFD